MYLQLNTQFNPFTYDEMVKPLLYYKQAYDEAEANYTALSAQTDVLRDRLDPIRDSESYNDYVNYSDTLRTIVDDFSQGMTSKNRRQLVNMKRGYAKTIQPINEAIERKKVLSEEQRQLAMKDPTMMFEMDANDLSIDDIRRNPTIRAGRNYSGTMLTAQVQQQVANFAKWVRDTPEGKSKLKKLLPYQYEKIEYSGFSPEVIAATIAGTKGGSIILKDIVENAVDASGIKTWNNPEALTNAYKAANAGLWAAMGTKHSQILKDDYNMQAALISAKANATSGTKTSEGHRRTSKDPYLYTPETTSAQKKAYKRLIKDPKKHYVKAGLSNTLIHQGKNPIKAYEEYMNEFRTISNGYRGKNNAKYEEMAKKGDALRTKYFGSNVTPEQINDLILDIAAMKEFGINADTKYDTIYSTIRNRVDSKKQYTYSPYQTNYDMISEHIISKLQDTSKTDQWGNKLYEVKSNGKRGKPININDLRSKFTEKTAIYNIQIDPNQDNPAEFIKLGIKGLKDNESITIWADPNVIDGSYAEGLQVVIQAGKNYEYDTDQLGEAGAGYTYDRINSFNKVQSQTSSNL